MLAGFVGIVLIVTFGCVHLYNRYRLNTWHRQSARYGNSIIVAGHRCFYRLSGTGPKTVVIECGLGTPCAEWWHVQDAITPFARCFSYDRAGYGWSESGVAPRTSQQIAHELNALLEQVGLQPPYIFVGHSQGGLYINHYARLFPDNVEAIVFVDPLSPRDNAFKAQLSPEVFRASGVDKTLGIRLLRPLSKSGLLRLLKPLMLKSPPFYYYKHITPEIIEIMWQHLLLPGVATTALDEYAQAHRDDNNQPLLDNAGFPKIPIAVIYHTPEIIVEEIVKYGGLEKRHALAVEQLWETLVREYLQLSPTSRWIGTTHSSHFVHMDEPQCVVDAVKQLAAINST